MSVCDDWDTPYDDVISRLYKIVKLESPMCKLEGIYTSCTKGIE